MSDKLLPCPFCGSLDNLEFVENRQSDFSFRIRCINCDSFSFDHNCTRYSEPSPEAVAAWNTRNGVSNKHSDTTGTSLCLKCNVAYTGGHECQSKNLKTESEKNGRLNVEIDAMPLNIHLSENSCGDVITFTGTIEWGDLKFETKPSKT